MAHRTVSAELPPHLWTTDSPYLLNARKAYQLETTTTLLHTLSPHTSSASMAFLCYSFLLHHLQFFTLLNPFVVNLFLGLLPLHCCTFLWLIKEAHFILLVGEVRFIALIFTADRYYFNLWLYSVKYCSVFLSLPYYFLTYGTNFIFYLLFWVQCEELTYLGKAIDSALILRWQIINKSIKKVLIFLIVYKSSL